MVGCVVNLTCKVRTPGEDHKPGMKRDSCSPERVEAAEIIGCSYQTSRLHLWGKQAAAGLAVPSGGKSAVKMPIG